MENFIPGFCRVWCRRTNQPYWQMMPYKARGYSDCVSLVEYYESEWGNLYDYVITADSPLCRPPAVVSNAG